MQLSIVEKEEIIRIERKTTAILRLCFIIERTVKNLELDLSLMFLNNA